MPGALAAGSSGSIALIMSIMEIAPSSLPAVPERLPKKSDGSNFPANRFVRSPPTGPRSRAMPLTPKFGAAMPPTRLTGKLSDGPVLLYGQVDLGDAGLETVVQVIV